MNLLLDKLFQVMFVLLSMLLLFVYKSVECLRGDSLMEIVLYVFIFILINLIFIPLNILRSKKNEIKMSKQKICNFKKIVFSFQVFLSFIIEIVVFYQRAISGYASHISYYIWLLILIFYAVLSILVYFRLIKMVTYS